MGYPPIDVDTSQYESASDLFYDANDAAADAVVDASVAADGAGGMAGCDSSGVEWSQQYDSTAAQALVAGTTLVDTLGHLANLLSATGANHDGADASSVPTGAGYPPYDTGAGRGDGSSVVVPTPPSADGTPGREPDGWGLIAHLMSWTWPNGHQDQLRQVGAGWTRAGIALQNHSYDLAPAIAHVQSVTSPEVASVVSACTDAQTHMNDLGTVYVEIGQSCDDYAGYLDSAHKDVRDELVSFLEWTAGIEAAGFLGSFITFGGAEVAAQGVEATRAAVTAGRVASILSRLADLVRTVVGVVGRAFSKIGEIIAKLKNLLSKGVSRALEKVGSKLPGGGKLAEKLKNADVHPKGNLPSQGGPPNGILTKVDSKGNVTNYIEYDENGNAIKRVDLTGATHNGVPTPHTVQYRVDTNPRTGQTSVRPNNRDVRPATPDEIP